ncbi:Rossmann-like and DUF2520 domain-containing protein [Algoriphagus hitonicola]|uniref:Predicted oxidoreductase, contains short-chain dehydrogenase (SDR) and DUF2520 domains n=1 Tax=Algoriphagus hitonicola TaxID=435880 RepID=A0A1I2URP5_9BACT|nr:Rossmann-like and DUF2520 domain-containing protein [Algoriphagus hitonicola]SFG79784.1 Predicted oxidoreductase, contains short-chain dehydrogenase (SDR) and DUF2520 domains [Algoriphagus hitonicola]
MKFRIAIIGAGNVAWHLAPALEEAGHEITEVYARTSEAAKEVTKRLYTTEPKLDLDFSESRAEIFILAIKDDTVAEVADSIILPEGSILVHTSGTLPLEILSYSSASFTGIFYPLQSFTAGQKMDLSEVPFLIESSDQEVLQKLKKMAKSISNQCFIVRSKDRKAIHVAAVFASNFSNHMIRISEEIMQRQGLDFEMMKPLIVETISKSLQIGAKKAQTGPAIREDYETLEDHFRFLNFNPELAEIYRLISQDIIDS